jgi:hypothetical protein
MFVVSNTNSKRESKEKQSTWSGASGSGLNPSEDQFLVRAYVTKDAAYEKLREENQQLREAETRRKHATEVSALMKEIDQLKKKLCMTELNNGCTQSGEDTF